MKVARLIIALAAVLLSITVLVMPQIIEAGHFTWPNADKNVAAAAPVRNKSSQEQTGNVSVGTSVRNDTSAPLRDMKPSKVGKKVEREANENPKVPASMRHVDAADPVVQSASAVMAFANINMPSPLLNFDGVFFPGVACNCAPPDTNGEVGATQYVQMVNEGFQGFDKTTGASVLGPSGITTLWSGFVGVCQSTGTCDAV